jgi:hypothetical protein
MYFLLWPKSHQTFPDVVGKWNLTMDCCVLALLFTHRQCNWISRGGQRSWWLAFWFDH